jgi:hypothetical protein
MAEIDVVGDALLTTSKYGTILAIVLFRQQLPAVTLTSNKYS